MTSVVLAEAINCALSRALEDDERVVILGEDVGQLGGVFRVTDGLQARFGERRVFDTPLAESAVVGTAYGGGVRTPEHHSDSLEAQLVHSPGLKVVVPSTPADAAGLLLAAIDDPDPVVFMEPIRLYRSARGELPERLEPTPLGQAAVRRRGHDVTLVAWGAMMPIALEAAEQVATEGIQTAVIDLRTLSPLDLYTVAASVEETGRL